MYRRFIKTLSLVLSCVMVICNIQVTHIHAEEQYQHSETETSGSVTMKVEWNDPVLGQPTTFHVSATGGSGSYLFRMDAPSYTSPNERNSESVADPSRGEWMNYTSECSSTDYSFTMMASGTYNFRFYLMDKPANVMYLRISTNIQVSDPNYPSVNSLIQSAVAQCNKETDGTEYAKALWLHDWLLNQLEYDHSFKWSSAESALTRNLGTCQAYQSAYSQLLNAAGIENAETRDTGDAHTWNAIKLDGEWYQVDCTWDDSNDHWYDFDQRRLYFGLTDELMAVAHPLYSPKYVFLMLFMILLHYGLGLLINKYSDDKRMQKLILFLMVVIDVCILGYFKYLNFIVSIFTGKADTFKIALPIGISFFTFQAISYVVDVYRGKGKVQTQFLNVGLYISLFPQLIAGPIVRYETVANEIENRKENLNDFAVGVNRFIIGLGKKVLLANQFAVVSDTVFGNVTSTGTTNSFLLLWMGAIAYTLQIFFDFAGYSDMAIGLGRMFGFHFLENFKYPYISKSISEFWRRWHISLQTWFKDYIYIPLGGSRVNSKARLVFNIFVVWFLTGVWHGANWTFIVWGLMYFVLLILEKFFHIDEKMGEFKNLYTMFFVMMGWVLFRSDSLSAALVYIRSMFGFGCKGFMDAYVIQYFKQYILYFIMGIFCCFPIFKNHDRIFKKNISYNLLYVICMCGIMYLSIIFIFSNAYNPFIYFNFLEGTRKEKNNNDRILFRDFWYIHFNII